MSAYLSAQLREEVAKRAGFTCEYCLISEEDTFHACQVDHIISLKHGGKTEFENLAFACSFCNRNKGSDLGTILPPENRLVRFFNPRTDIWENHFSLQDAMILGKTPIGLATVNIFRFNTPETVIDRQLLIHAGRYPGRH